MRRRTSKRRGSRKLRSNKRRGSRKLRSVKRHSRKLRSNKRRGSRKLRSVKRHSRKLRSNKRRGSRKLRSVKRHSRKLRSNKRHSRKIRRNSAAMHASIARGFARLHKPPMVGRIKRLFDKPSKVTYYGAPAYLKKFGKIKPADAKRYARKLGVLVANTLVGGLSPKYASHRVGHPSQVVETSEGSRMWNASYPITVSAYQTTGYIRDFKFGGIAKKKANAARGVRFKGGRKRKHSRNVA